MCLTNLHVCYCYDVIQYSISFLQQYSLDTIFVASMKYVTSVSCSENKKKQNRLYWVKQKEIGKQLHDFMAKIDSFDAL